MEKLGYERIMRVSEVYGNPKYYEIAFSFRDIAAEGLAQGAIGAAEIGAAMAEEAIAEEMGEGED